MERDELSKFNTERIGDSGHRQQTRIAPTPFDSANVSEVQLGFKSELFLRYRPRLSATADIGPNDAPPVHHGKAWASRTIKTLGTIVPIMEMEQIRWQDNSTKIL